MLDSLAIPEYTFLHHSTTPEAAIAFRWSGLGKRRPGEAAHVIEVPRMKRKLIVLFLTSMVALTTVGTALADQRGPNPQPPKCVPANTPGCS
jgi:hypothetical protein